MEDAVTTTGLQFDDEGSSLVEAFNTTPGAVARRRKILHSLALARGERVLDVGSGPGHLALDMANAVGSSGKVYGVDNSENMIAVSRARCASQPAIEFHLADATRLPFTDNHFDAAVSSQTFEYLTDVAAPLGEIWRVLRPGGRVLIHDTDWDSIVWYSSDQARMNRILAAWDKHLVDPHLPQKLAAKLRHAGFLLQHQDIILQFDPEYGSNTVSHWLIEFIVGFVVGQDGIAQGEAAAWAADLRKLGQGGEYFFSLNEYIFLALKPDARSVA